MKRIYAICTYLIYLLSSCVFDCDRYLIKHIKPLVINGVLKEKSKSQTGCFGNIILKQKEYADTLQNICYCVPENQGLWEYIIPGDSLFKEKGSLTVEVYRKGTIKKFDYPCCSE
jgi:hypothetical protein